ncbi:MAG: NfeD family protein [Bryobacteraceae bacterium]
MINLLANDPNLAFTFLLFGTLALLWELHAPGLILPGLLGVVVMAAGAWGLYQNSPTPYGLALLLLAVLFLAIEISYHTHMISGLSGSVLLGAGAILLFRGPKHIDPSLAVAASAALAAITAFLGFLAVRSRSEKHLTGPEAMVGAIGISKTPLSPDGMVMVRGEYWNAHSTREIAAGKPIVVEAMRDFTLLVREAS